MLPTSSFQFFRYDAEPSCQPVVLRATTSWSHAGALLDPGELPPGYHAWANATVKSGNLLALLIPFLEFLHKWLADTHMTHYLLTIRAQKPTSDFDRPRWHVDRRFFQPPDSSQEMCSSENLSAVDGKNSLREEKRIPASVYKVATALVGPGTLFLKDSAKGIAIQRKVENDLKVQQRKKGHYAVDEKHICHTFRCLGCTEMADNVRVRLAKEIEKEELEVVQTTTTEVSIFRADGDGGGGGKGVKGEIAAMHSEPPMSNGDRVFVHVVPGTEEEVRRLVENWGMEFPRNWSVGVLNNW